MNGDALVEGWLTYDPMARAGYVGLRRGRSAHQRWLGGSCQVMTDEALDGTLIGFEVLEPLAGQLPVEEIAVRYRLDRQARELLRVLGDAVVALARGHLARTEAAMELDDDLGLDLDELEDLPAPGDTEPGRG
jgi:hypothetical protein